MFDNNVTTNQLDELMELMENGRVIPVISNAFRLEEIFKHDAELQTLMSEEPQFYDELPTIHQQLTKKWAQKIRYPMSDDHNLARVAQYRQVNKGEGEGARKEYLKFLVDRLIEINEADEKYKEVVNGLKLKGNPSLSYTVEKLEYPRFTNGTVDPLKLLAKLPVKIYITTSYSDFLERALELEDKKPRTQLCFCRKSPNIDPGFLPDRDFRPDADHPAVVHLFGLEKYSNTLVLSEDDYINFLLSAVEEINSQDVYPSYLRLALPEASLLLLGYHLRDWDFRTLFRFILKIRKSEYSDVTTSMAIQFKPKVSNEDNKKATQAYLSKYFESRKFQVWWSETEEFIDALWNAWERYNPNRE